MATIVFFPWLKVCEEYQVPGARLVPYRRKQAPLLNPDHQAEVDKQLGCYYLSPGAPLLEATLVVVDTDSPIRDLEDSELLNLRRLRLAMAVQGLRDRRLFDGALGYCNDDHFRLMHREFRIADGDGITFFSRRRDGRILSHWSLEEVSQLIPDHVGRQHTYTPDVQFLQKLCARLSSEPALEDSLSCFLRANTDTDELEVDEIVSMVSAFERLVGSAANAKDFVRQVRRFASFPDGRTAADLGAKHSRNRTQGDQPVTEIWLAELYHSRGSIAHGNRPGLLPHTWTIREHLLLGSLLYPLLLERTIDCAPRTNVILVTVFEELLVHTDLFRTEADGTWPWRKILDEAQDRARWEGLKQAALQAFGEDLE